MPSHPLSEALANLDPASPQYATAVVEKALALAQAAGASDVHIQPGGDGLELRWRIDGVLQPVALLPAKVAPNIVARLKVLSELLTYRTDVPQEGRIKGLPGEVEMRVSTFPTLFGEKAVVRMFAAPGRYLRLLDLGLPGAVCDQLEHLLGETSGAIVLSGPAGSGKTTTIYACLRELAARSRGERSLATLEDPIEAIVPGVAQAQVNSAAGLTLESGLKSLLRQDPEVIAIGEIRDKTTAEIALQAALTGHLILTTFHAGSACEVIGRFLDMGIEPYVVRSGLRDRRPAPGAAALRLCGSWSGHRRLPRSTRAPRQATPRLRCLSRHRLRRTDPSGRASLTRNRRARPGRPRLLRRAPARRSGRRCRHDRSLGTAPAWPSKTGSPPLPRCDASWASPRSPSGHAPDCLEKIALDLL